MTCDDVKAIAFGGRWQQTTRAERAVIVKHIHGCGSCRQWLRDGVVQAVQVFGTDQATAIVAGGARRCAEDMRDPEFREACLG